MANRPSPCLRVFSAFLAASFLYQSAAWSAPEIVSAALIPAKLAIPAFPDSVALIEDRLSGDKGVSIYLIQTAHTNDSAQKNIAQIAETLYADEQVSSVYVEGGSGDASLAFLRPQASLEKRRQVAHSFLMQGELNGVEYLDLASDLPLRVWGVEDRELYLKSVRAYGEVAAARVRFQPVLDRFRSAAESVKPLRYNPALLDFDRLRQNHLAGTQSLVDYFSALTVMCAKYGIELRYYPELDRLSGITRLERAIDFAQARRDEARAFEALSSEEKTELLDGGKADADKDPKDIKRQHAVIAYLAQKNDDFRSMPELAKYRDYLGQLRAMDSSRALSELSLLENELYRKLFRSTEEQEFQRADEAVRLLAKLSTLTMTPDEYAAYGRYFRGRSAAELAGYLNRSISESDRHYDKIIFWDAAFEGFLRGAEGFYELTFERDRQFVRGLLDDMRKNGTRKAALLTGGYHNPNLKRLLAEEGAAYVSILPQMTKETNLKRYEKILLERSGAAGQTAARTDSQNEVWAAAQTPAVVEKIGARLAARRETDVPQNLSAQQVQARKNKYATQGKRVSGYTANRKPSKPQTQRTYDGARLASGRLLAISDLKFSELYYKKYDPKWFSNSLLNIGTTVSQTAGAITATVITLGLMSVFPFFVIVFLTEGLRGVAGMAQALYEPVFVFLSEPKQWGGLYIAEFIAGASFVYTAAQGFIAWFSNRSDAQISDYDKQAVTYERVKLWRQTTDKHSFTEIGRKVLQAEKHSTSQRDFALNLELEINIFSFLFDKKDEDAVRASVLLLNDEDARRWIAANKKVIELISNDFANSERTFLRDLIFWGMSPAEIARTSDVFVSERAATLMGRLPFHESARTFIYSLQKMTAIFSERPGADPIDVLKSLTAYDQRLDRIGVTKKWGVIEGYQVWDHQNALNIWLKVNLEERRDAMEEYVSQLERASVKVADFDRLLDLISGGGAAMNVADFSRWLDWYELKITNFDSLPISTKARSSLLIEPYEFGESFSWSGRILLSETVDALAAGMSSLTVGSPNALMPLVASSEYSRLRAMEKVEVVSAAQKVISEQRESIQYDLFIPIAQSVLNESAPFVRLIADKELIVTPASSSYDEYTGITTETPESSYERRFYRIAPVVVAGSRLAGMGFDESSGARLASEYHENMGRSYVAGEIQVPARQIVRKMSSSEAGLNLNPASAGHAPAETIDRYVRTALDRFKEAKTTGEKFMILPMMAGEASRMGKGKIAALVLQALDDAPEQFVDSSKIASSDSETVAKAGGLPAYVRSLVAVARGQSAQAADAADRLKALLYDAKALNPAAKVGDRWYNFLAFNLIKIKHANDELEAAGYGRPFVPGAMLNEKYKKAVYADLERNAYYGIDSRDLVVFYQPLGYAVSATEADVDEIIRDEEGKLAKGALTPDQLSFKSEADKAFARQYARENAGSVLYDLGKKAEGRGWIYPALLLTAGDAEEPAIVAMNRLKVNEVLVHNLDNMATVDRNYLASLGYKWSNDKLVTFEVSPPTEAEKGRGGGAIWATIDGQDYRVQAEWDIMQSSAKAANKTPEQLIAETPDSPFNNATEQIAVMDAFRLIFGADFDNALSSPAVTATQKAERDQKLAGMVETLGRIMMPVPLKRVENITIDGQKHPIARVLFELRAWEIQNAAPQRVDFFYTSNFENRPTLLEQGREALSAIRFAPLKTMDNYDNSSLQDTRTAIVERVVDPSRSLFGLPETAAAARLALPVEQAGTAPDHRGYVTYVYRAKGESPAVGIAAMLEQSLVYENRRREEINADLTEQKLPRVNAESIVGWVIENSLKRSVPGAVVRPGESVTVTYAGARLAEQGPLQNLGKQAHELQFAALNVNRHGADAAHVKGIYRNLERFGEVAAKAIQAAEQTPDFSALPLSRLSITAAELQYAAINVNRYGTDRARVRGIYENLERFGEAAAKAIQAAEQTPDFSALPLSRLSITAIELQYAAKNVNQYGADRSRVERVYQAIEQFGKAIVETIEQMSSAARLATSAQPSFQPGSRSMSGQDALQKTWEFVRQNPSSSMRIQMLDLPKDLYDRWLDAAAANSLSTAGSIPSFNASASVLVGESDDPNKIQANRQKLETFVRDFIGKRVLESAEFDQRLFNVRWQAIQEKGATVYMLSILFRAASTGEAWRQRQGVVSGADLVGARLAQTDGRFLESTFADARFSSVPLATLLMPAPVAAQNPDADLPLDQSEIDRVVRLAVQAWFASPADRGKQIPLLEAAGLSFIQTGEEGRGLRIALVSPSGTVRNLAAIDDARAFLEGLKTADKITAPAERSQERGRELLAFEKMAFQSAQLALPLGIGSPNVRAIENDLSVLEDITDPLAFEAKLSWQLSWSVSYARSMRRIVPDFTIYFDASGLEGPARAAAETIIARYASTGLIAAGPADAVDGVVLSGISAKKAQSLERKSNRLYVTIDGIEQNSVESWTQFYQFGLWFGQEAAGNYAGGRIEWDKIAATSERVQKGYEYFNQHADPSAPIRNGSDFLHMVSGQNVMLLLSHRWIIRSVLAELNALIAGARLNERAVGIAA